MSDPATLAWYQREAPVYGSLGPGGASRHLDRFLDRLAPGAQILELGCGGGRDAAHIAQRGFAIDPTDGTSALVAKTIERTGLPARRMLFDELAADNSYDAVWAHASLLHAPRASLPGILKRIHRALRPQGWHFANYKLGNGEGRDPLGRLNNFPDADWLDARYRDAGFELVDCEAYRGNGADGVIRDWRAITVQKGSES